MSFKDDRLFAVDADTIYDYKDPDDPTNGGTDFSKVRGECMGFFGNCSAYLRRVITPTCVDHGSMNKVAAARGSDYGLWRCLAPGCRAACTQHSKPIQGFSGMLDSVTKEPWVKLVSPLA